MAKKSTSSSKPRVSPKSTRRSTGSYSPTDNRLSELFGITNPLDIERINEITALTSSPVYAAMGLISKSLAILPKQVVRRTKDGREEAPDHPSQRMLSISPDPDEGISAYTWMETSMYNTLGRGNTVSEIGRNYRGQAIRAYRLRPQRIMFDRTQDGKRLYKVFDEKGEKRLDVSQVLHIPCICWDGYVGVSPITHARTSIGIGLASDKYQLGFYKGGGKRFGFLKKKTTVTPEQRKKLRKEWEDIHGGTDNFFDIGILSGGWEWQDVGISQHDAQFLQSREFTIYEIARWFGVPPHLISQLDKSSETTLEHELLRYTLFTLLPWVVKWEQEFRMKLFTPDEQFAYSVEFDLDFLLRADSKTKFENLERQLRNAMRTPDEIRTLLKMPIYPDGLGKKPLVMASQMATLEQIMSGNTAYGKQGQTPDPDPAKPVNRLDQNSSKLGLQSACDIVTLLSERLDPSEREQVYDHVMSLRGYNPSQVEKIKSNGNGHKHTV